MRGYPRSTAFAVVTLGALVVGVVGAFGLRQGFWILLPGLILVGIGFLLRDRVFAQSAGSIYGVGKVSTDYRSRGYSADMHTAGALVREGNWVKAAELYSTMVEKAPKEAEPLFLLAQTYERMDKPVQAQLSYRRLIDRFAERLGEDHPYVLESQEKLDSYKSST